MSRHAACIVEVTRLIKGEHEGGVRQARDLAPRVHKIAGWPAYLHNLTQGTTPKLWLYLASALDVPFRKNCSVSGKSSQGFREHGAHIVLSSCKCKWLHHRKHAVSRHLSEPFFTCHAAARRMRLPKPSIFHMRAERGGLERRLPRYPQHALES